MCPTPARPGKIGDTQLDPTTREITICLSKNWLRALALWTVIQKKNYTEITIRQIWRIHSRENRAWFVFDKFDATT
jgi:hypothetical protein